MRRTLLALTAATVMLPLAACSGGDVTQPTETPSVSTSDTPPSSSSSSSTDTPSSSSTEPGTSSSTTEPTPSSSSSSSSNEGGTLKFGDSYTFKNGVKITVGKPVAYTPDKYSGADKKWAKYAKFPITLVNGADKAVKASSYDLKATAGTQQSDSIWGDGLGGSSASVLPGKTLVWAEAYGYNEGDEITLELSQFLDFNDDSTAYFVGKP